ncbi:MAG TPA: DUF2971 domain-containing protein [Chthoniobacterales bacterium]
MIYERPQAETRPAPPARLYKYMECVRDGKDSGALRFFKSGMMRFTQPVEFNDPFEMQPFVKGLADEPAIEKQVSEQFESTLESELAKFLGGFTSQQRALVDSVISKDQLLGAVRKQSPQLLGLVKLLERFATPLVSRRIYDTVNENLGALCLTEEPVNLLMWAHYADQHKGAVIEFDAQHGFFNKRVGPKDDFRHFRPVTYAQQRPAVFLSDSDAIDFFYFKSTEWGYEHEWRLIVPLVDCNERKERTPPDLPICLFHVPPECVLSVILGCRTPEREKLKLVKAVRSNPAFRHVAFEQAEPDKQVFELLRRPIPSDALDRWVESVTQSVSNGT